MLTFTVSFVKLILFLYEPYDCESGICPSKFGLTLRTSYCCKCYVKSARLEI